MKKLFSLALCFFTVILSFAHYSQYNAQAQSFSDQPIPSFGLNILEENSNLVIEYERLYFDLSDFNANNYSSTATLKADYKIKNNGEDISAKFAIPFISPPTSTVPYCVLNNDGNPLSLSVHYGDSYFFYDEFTKDDILNINYEPIDLSGIGVLYTFDTSDGMPFTFSANAKSKAVFHSGSNQSSMSANGDISITLSKPHDTYTVFVTEGGFNEEPISSALFTKQEMTYMDYFEWIITPFTDYQEELFPSMDYLLSLYSKKINAHQKTDILNDLLKPSGFVFMTGMFSLDIKANEEVNLSVLLNLDVAFNQYTFTSPIYSFRFMPSFNSPQLFYSECTMNSALPYIIESDLQLYNSDGKYLYEGNSPNSFYTVFSAELKPKPVYQQNPQIDSKKLIVLIFCAVLFIISLIVIIVNLVRFIKHH